MNRLRRVKTWRQGKSFDFLYTVNGKEPKKVRPPSVVQLSLIFIAFRDAGAWGIK